MEISYPFNASKIDTPNGPVLPQTKAYWNVNCSSYALEKQRADELGVKRELKGTPEFDAMLKAYPSVKWAYTVHRLLYITPEHFRGEEVPHSIAAGNMPVFCAGIAEFKAGAVIVNNWTGHYKVPVDRAVQDIKQAWADAKVNVLLGDMIGNGSSSQASQSSSSAAAT